jgi:hypothetical protein
MTLPLSRPTDCAAAGGPTISRVRGCINDEMKECVICAMETAHDWTEHPFFGFAAQCPYGPPKEEEREP